MKFKSPVYSMVSGSIAGLTYAHNRGGMYARARANPTNPNTSFQVSVRDAVMQGTDRWTNTLTAPNRESWANYAANTPILDRFGDPRNLTGQQMFLRTYTTAVQAMPLTVDQWDTAPAINDLGTFTAPTFTPDASAGNVAVAFTDTDAWANATNGALLIKCSRMQNPSVNFFKSPFRFMGAVLGNTITPPTSPATITGIFTPWTAGQKLFFEVRALDSTGRLTTPSIYSAIIVA